MTFYGESLLMLGIFILIIFVAATTIFGLINIISSKRIKSRLAKEYGEKPNK